MNPSISIIYYTSKTLKNGNHPLMLRIIQNRQTKYVSLGVNINPKFWDIKKNEPKRNCPNREAIQRLIIEKMKEYTDKIIDLKVEKREFTAKTLVEKIKNTHSCKTVGEIFLQQIEQLKRENRIGYALSHTQVYNSLIEFNKHLDIYFSDIDVQWLRKYETWLKGQNLAYNTIGIRFRTLRTVYNIAIKEGYVKAEFYPFKDYKVSKLHENTPKRAIVKDNVIKVMNHKEPVSNSSYNQLAIDLFTFSYLMGGINFTDMARLTGENIMDEQLVYRRKKTRKLIPLPIHPKAMEIMNKYKSDNPYIFPILSSFHKTEQQKLNRIHKVIGKVNACLKTLGNELELDKKLTTYVARHSYATTLKRAGVSTSLICDALGHSSERVTQIYLDSFENTQLKAAMKNLL